MVDCSAFEPFYPMVTERCLEWFDQPDDVRGNAFRLMKDLMSLEGLPMHCPVHHYIVPAVLLSVCRKAQGYERTLLEDNLNTALDRSKSVLPGFCGFCGSCGAAVGNGIFWSIITDSTPYSEKTWGLMNSNVGETLLAISQYGGPRCCKRTSFLALKIAADQIKKVLKIELPLPDKLSCDFFERNAECLHTVCPFYRAEGDS